MQISGVGLEKMNEFMYSPITERAPVPHIFGTLVSARRFPSAPRQLAGASVVMLWLLIFLLSWIPQTMGQEDDLNDDNLVELWIDELLKVEITSVSKKAKKRVEAATQQAWPRINEFVQKWTEVAEQPGAIPNRWFRLTF